MKTLIGAVVAICVSLIAFLAYDPPTLYYNRGGIIKKQMKVWADTIAVSSANPSINISSAGFSNIISVQPQIIQSSATLSNFAWCNVTTYSTSSVTLFLSQQNNNTINILGSLVLLGTPLQQPTTFTNMSVAIQVIGY